MSSTNANFPSVRPDWMPMEWYAFFLALFNRTGGPGSPIDINSLQKQDEISQDVPPQNAATMAALQGINDLWAEQRAPENMSAIQARLADLEGAIQLAPDLPPILQKLNDLEAWLADVKQPAPAVPEQWNAPTLLNSWVNFGGTDSIAGYWKDPLGIVHLRGVVKSGTASTPFFVLPAGYRPAYRTFFPAISNDAFAAFYVDTDGTVQPYVGSGATYFTIDGATFRAA